MSRADSGKLIDKVLAKYVGWKKRFLSTAGRVTLIQLVTSAIPIYNMQSIWLPEHICNRLDKMNRDFPGSNDIDKRKTHLVGWKKVVQPKKRGLGIREARLNNEAMLAKIVRKVLKQERSIWMDLVQSKYLKGQSILHYTTRSGDSPMWKGVLESCRGT